MPRALALKGVRPRYRWLTLGEDHAPPTGSEFDSSESYTRKPSYKDSDGKFAQTCSLKFGWVLTAPIARCDAFEISDAVVAALSHQRDGPISAVLRRWSLLRRRTADMGPSRW